MKFFSRILILFLFFLDTALWASIPLKISLGTGIAIKNNLRINNQYRSRSNQLILTPIPLVQLSYGPIFIGQQGLTMSFLGNREKSLYLNINRGGERYDGVGMISRQTSWFAGVGAKYHKFNFIISKDIEGESHGLKSQFTFTEIYTIKEKFFTRSSIGLEYYDRNFMDYYYGVRQSEVTSTRAEYHSSNALNFSTSFFPGYKFNEHLNLLSGLVIKYLHSHITESPTSRKQHFELSLISGLLYQF